jgi:hypothetical protein
MNEPYNQIPQSFSFLSNIFKRVEKVPVVETEPHDFGKGIYIREWQLEIPYNGISLRDCIEKRFDMKISSLNEPDTITFYNGLVIHFDIVDRNVTFRK